MRGHERRTRAGLISAIRKLAANRKAVSGRRRGRAVRFLTFGKDELREFNRSVLPMRIFDRETLRYLAVNDAALKLYGYTREEFLTLTLKDIRHPGEHADIFPALAEPTGYLTYQGPRRHLKKSGEVIVVEVIWQEIIFNGRMARLSAAIDVTERTRAEEELRRQKRLLDAIIDNLPVGVFIKDAKTFRYLLRNRFNRAVFGCLVEDYVGKTAHDMFPKEQADRFTRTDREAVETRRMVEIREQEAIGRSGDVRIQHMRKVPLFDETGQPWLIVGISDDITERKEVERALHESESRYRSLVESSSDLIWSADAEGRITFINQAARRIYGYEPEEMLGRPVGEFLGEAQPTKVFGFFRAMLAEGRSWADYECEVRRKDGERVVLSSNAIILRDAEGKRIGVTGISKDITARKRAEQALREKTEFLQRMIESSRDCLKVLDLDGRLLWMSAGGQRLMEIDDASSLLGRSYLDFWSGAERDIARKALDTARAGEANRFEGYCPTSQGVPKWWDEIVTPVLGDDGSPEKLLVVSRDITEHKRAEEERVKQALRQRDALVREVHHRIKNNLQGVVGLLRQLAAGDPSARPVIDKAVSQLQAITVVYGLEARRVSRAIVLRDILLAIAPAVQGMTGAELELDCGPTEDARVELAETEAVAVALVLNELLTNAARSSGSTPESGAVSVILRTEEESVRVTISNSGRLPPQFDFARARGLGTGLELVRSLLPHQGARLTFFEADGRVNAELKISAPVLVTRGAPALAAQH